MNLHDRFSRQSPKPIEMQPGDFAHVQYYCIEHEEIYPPDTPDPYNTPPSKRQLFLIHGPAVIISVDGDMRLEHVPMRWDYYNCLLSFLQGVEERFSTGLRQVQVSAIQPEHLGAKHPAYEPPMPDEPADDDPMTYESQTKGY
tara:strand:- start:84 stop:512 length:429 start_codon:yes stop_codon:yes gene_type:complete